VAWSIVTVSSLSTKTSVSVHRELSVADFISDQSHAVRKTKTSAPA